MRTLLSGFLLALICLYLWCLVLSVNSIREGEWSLSIYRQMEAAHKYPQLCCREQMSGHVSWFRRARLSIYHFVKREDGLHCVVGDETCDRLREQMLGGNKDAANSLAMVIEKVVGESFYEFAIGLMGGRARVRDMCAKLDVSDL